MGGACEGGGLRVVFCIEVSYWGSQAIGGIRSSRVAIEVRVLAK